MEDIQREIWQHIIYFSVCNSWRMGRHFANILVNSSRVITIRPDNEGADPYKFWEPITYMMQKASKVALVSKQFLEVRLRLASRIRIVHRGLELPSVRAFCVALVRHKLWRYTLSYFYKLHPQGIPPHTEFGIFSEQVVIFPGRKPAVERYCIFLDRWADPVESLPERNIMDVKGMDIVCQFNPHFTGLVIRG